MTEIVTLSCPSCGGKLEITQDIEQFACAYCGREQIVKRGSGIISLSPLVDGMKRVEIGIDRTAAELAIVRISKEIAILVKSRKQVYASFPRPVKAPINSSLLLIYLSIVLGVCSLFVLSLTTPSVVIYLVPGLGLIAIGIFSFLYGKNTYSNKCKVWETSMRERLKPIDENIRLKTLELERNRGLVSQ